MLTGKSQSQSKTYMGVGSRKWSKPGEEADQLEWSQKNGHSHHKPLPSPAGWWGEEGPQFSSISTKHRLCHLAFTGRKAEATLLVSEKLSYGSRL